MFVWFSLLNEQNYGSNLKIKTFNNFQGLNKLSWDNNLKAEKNKKKNEDIRKTNIKGRNKRME